MQLGSSLRIIFMGTPDFAVPALKALYEDGHEIVSVYTREPKPKGRGKEIAHTPVSVFAQKNGIPVRTPRSLKRENEYVEEIKQLKPDLIVVAAYGLILPKEVLEAPEYGCLNIHASLLPRWRGASPIQQAILAGDKESGVCIMHMDEGLDTGDVVSGESIPLDRQINSQILHDRLSLLGAEMIKKCARKIATEGKFSSTPQGEKGATHAPIITKEDGRIDWNKNANQIDQQIRAFTPWPGSWSKSEGNRFKILEVASENSVTEQEKQKSPGTVLDKSGKIICGEGTALHITRIQPHNKKPMDFVSTINGGYLKEGSVFE